jgi:hypothetical protein
MIEFAILSMVGNVLVSLTTLVFLMACGANSSPKQLHELKMMMLGVTVCGFAGFVGGIIAIVKAHYGLSLTLNVLPVVGCIGLFVWMFLAEY